jgi:hypothetical protein
MKRDKIRGKELTNPVTEFKTATWQVSQTELKMKPQKILLYLHLNMRYFFLKNGIRYSISWINLKAVDLERAKQPASPFSLTFC